MVAVIAVEWASKYNQSNFLFGSDSKCAVVALLNQNVRTPESSILVESYYWSSCQIKFQGLHHEDSWKEAELLIVFACYGDHQSTNCWWFFDPMFVHEFIHDNVCQIIDTRTSSLSSSFRGLFLFSGLF